MHDAGGGKVEQTLVTRLAALKHAAGTLLPHEERCHDRQQRQCGGQRDGQQPAVVPVAQQFAKHHGAAGRNVGIPRGDAGQRAVPREFVDAVAQALSHRPPARPRDDAQLRGQVRFKSLCDHAAAGFRSVHEELVNIHVVDQRGIRQAGTECHRGTRTARPHPILRSQRRSREVFGGKEAIDRRSQGDPFASQVVRAYTFAHDEGEFGEPPGLRHEEVLPPLGGVYPRRHKVENAGGEVPLDIGAAACTAPFDLDSLAPRGLRQDRDDEARRVPLLTPIAERLRVARTGDNTLPRRVRARGGHGRKSQRRKSGAPRITSSRQSPDACG